MSACGVRKQRLSWLCLGFALFLVLLAASFSQSETLRGIYGAAKENQRPQLLESTLIDSPPWNSRAESDNSSGSSGRENQPEEKLWQFRGDPFAAFWVRGAGNLLRDRIPLYNSAISRLRDDVIYGRGSQDWRDSHDNVDVLWGSRDDFLVQLGEFPHVKTVALEWLEDGENPREHWTSQKDFANLQVQDYYPLVATEPLCTWIRTPGFTKARYDAALNKTCTVDTDLALKATSVEPVYFYGKPINPNHYWPHDGLSYPSYFYTTLPRHVFYLHVLEDAIITQVGDVFSGNLKLVPYTCSHDRNPAKPSGYQSAAVHDEVFILTQRWGEGYFHKNFEVFPRLAPYIDFLLSHREIRVHVLEKGGRTAAVLQTLGLSHERLISGVIRAKIVYMPQGTACGFPQIQEMQVLAKLFADVIEKGATSNSQPQAMASLTGNTTAAEKLIRKNMVVIHRSGTRHLTDASVTEHALKSLADEHNLNYVLFNDKQLPSFEDTMRLFHQAALVFAPHGAGLANVMYCQPGTYVIEAVCNPPHVNLCYQWSAHVLGMRYHAIPSRGGCEGHISVEAAVITKVVKGYLDQIKLHSG